MNSQDPSCLPGDTQIPTQDEEEEILNLISGINKSKCWFHINAWQQGCWFHLKTSKTFHTARKLKNVDFRSK